MFLSTHCCINSGTRYKWLFLLNCLLFVLKFCPKVAFCSKFSLIPRFQALLTPPPQALSTINLKCVLIAATCLNTTGIKKIWVASCALDLLWMKPVGNARKRGIKLNSLQIVFKGGSGFRAASRKVVGGESTEYNLWIWQSILPLYEIRGWRSRQVSQCLRRSA